MRAWKIWMLQSHVSGLTDICRTASPIMAEVIFFKYIGYIHKYKSHAEPKKQASTDLNGFKTHMWCDHKGIKIKSQ